MTLDVKEGKQKLEQLTRWLERGHPSASASQHECLSEMGARPSHRRRLVLLWGLGWTSRDIRCFSGVDPHEAGSSM